MCNLKKRTNSTSFYETDGVQVLLKYALVVSGTLSELGIKGPQYDVVEIYFMDVSSFFIFLIIHYTFPI